MVCTRPLIWFLTVISWERLRLWKIWHHQQIVHVQAGTIGIKGPRLSNGKNTKETKFSIKKMICHKVTNLLSRGLRLCVNTSFVNPKLLMTVDWNTNSSTNGSSGPPSFPWVNGTMSEKYYPKNRGYHFYQEAHCCLFRVRVINFKPFFLQNFIHSIKYNSKIFTKLLYYIQKRLPTC